jgi:hypothetical protein
MPHVITRAPVPRWSARLALLFCTLALTSCGEAEQASGGDAIERTAAPVPITADTAGASCVASFVERPCDLLTDELLRQHVPALPADAERVDIAASMIERGIKPPSFGGMAVNGCSYTWDGGRKTAPKPAADPEAASEDANPYASALDALKYDRPVPDTVVFKSIKVLEEADPLAGFERRWRAPTDAEREALAQRMEEKMQEARKEGKLSESGAVTGSDLGRSLASASISYEAIEAVGTAARWGGVGAQRSLMVLDGATEFEVLVEVSDDESVNRDAAIRIARDLLGGAQSDCP